VTNTSFWKGLPAVKNNRVYFIERNQWLAYDSISLKGQLKDSVEIFKNNK
jgi:iron complex transport system substrate-binding protein